METAVKVACVQAEPVILDREATIDRVAELTGEAAAAGAQLVLFPEAFVPCYPSNRWVRSLAAGSDPEVRETFARLVRESVEIPGPACDRLAGIARDHGVWLATGVNERAGGTLYNTLLIHSPDGSLALHHRKLMPTNHERLVWGLGEGGGLHTVSTPFGHVGGLICWENLMPLARFALYQDRLEIHLAPTADTSDAWQESMRHIAREARCYVITACVLQRASSHPAGVPLVERAGPDGPRRISDPGARRQLPRRSAVGRARDPLRRPRSRPDGCRPPALRPGRSLQQTGRVPALGTSTGLTRPSERLRRERGRSRFLFGAAPVSSRRRLEFWWPIAGG